MSLDSTSQLGQMLASNANDTQDVAAAVSPDEDSPQTFRLYDETIIVEQGPVKGTIRNINSSTLWDVNYWDADDSFWNETYSTGFILNSATAGVLGTNLLGDPGTDKVLVLVHNKDNRFVDIFNTSTYIDTDNTTATINSEDVSFGSGTEEFLYSDVIVWEPEDSTSYETIKNVTVNLTGTDTEYAEIFIKTDTNDWEEVDEGTKTTLTNSGEKLYYRIDNNAIPSGIGFPMDWGEWGEINIHSMTLTNIEIYYEVV